MKRFLLAGRTGLFAALLHFLSPVAPAGSPVVSPRTFPGTQLGSTEARWIAPWVYSFSYRVAGHRDTMVRWYDETGALVNEVSGTGVDTNGEFVSERVDGQTFIHGVSGNWKFELPRKPEADVRDGSISEHGGIFIHQYYSRPEETMVDIYDRGKLAGSAGPFLDHRRGDATVGDDGCTTLITWKDADRKTSQIVVIGPDTGIRCRVDCGEDTWSPFAIARGKGALLKIAGQSRPEVPFRYVGADGEKHQFELPPNARPLVSLPSTDLVLFASELDNERFLLVHVRTGKIVWDVLSPVRKYPNAATQALVVKNRVLLLGLDMAALDLESGQTVAFWKDEKQKPAWGRFFQRGDEIFVFSPAEFFKLDLGEFEAPRKAVIDDLPPSVVGAAFSRYVFPGKQLGEVEARWIAPWVYTFHQRVASESQTIVRWYDTNGILVKEISGWGVNAHTEVVSERVDIRQIFHGISGTWTLELPKKFGKRQGGPFYECNGLFIHQYRNGPNELMIDAYDHGKLGGTAGPFFDHPRGGAHLRDDGCTILITWKDATRTTSQVVVLGPDAGVRCRVDCGEDTDQPFTIAQGEGVLVQFFVPHEPPGQFLYLGADGMRRELDHSVQGRPVVSLPSTDLVLFSTSAGEEERFLLAHVKTGKVVWDVHSPVRPYPNTTPQALVAKGKVLLLGLDMAALDLKSGQTIALWKSEQARPSWGRFFPMGDDVYVASDDEFFKLDFADIEAKRNGWK